MGRWLLGCGGALLVSLTAVSQIDARSETVLFLALMGGASVAYVGALWCIPRVTASQRLLVVCLLLGAVWRIALMSGAPLVSDDVYRYVWDGRVQRFGYNPYVSAPDDSALVHLHTDLTRQIDPTSAALPTIYPPVAELFFRVVTTAHESVTAMVMAVVLCDLLTVWVLWRWLLGSGRSPWWVLAYAWHPLVGLEGAGGGHVDVMGTLLVVTAAFTLSQRRGLMAALALAGAFAVKFLPIVLIPLFWRRVRLRDALVGGSLVGLAYLSFSGFRLMPALGSLGVYTETWRFNGPIFSLLEPWLGAVGVLVVAAGLGCAVAGVARMKLDVDDPAAWACPMGASLLLMPVVYPWYLIWVTPFLVTRATWPLVAWTLGSMATYLVWRSELAGMGWILPQWVVPLEYGLVAAVGLWAWRLPGPFPRPATS